MVQNEGGEFEEGKDGEGGIDEPGWKGRSVGGLTERGASKTYELKQFKEVTIH